MRRAIALVALVMTVAPPAFASPTAAHETVVQVGPEALAAPAPQVRCEGYAPETNHCTGSFTVTGGFGIRFGYQAGYYGYLHIKGTTPTYTVEIFCDVFLRGDSPNDCDVTRTGEMYVGQTFTLQALAPAFGYWLVEAPV